MNKINLLFALMLVVSSINMNAQDGTEAEFRKWALTPPMGWNSWDCYYSSINEEITMANAKVQQRKLLKYGYEYVVVDIRWYANHPSHGGGRYNEDNPDCQLDEYGRYIPSPMRFPSGFKWMADAIHRMGMKFGIHIMRGLPKCILDNPSVYKLKGAEDISWDKVYTSTKPECMWLKDNLTVRNNEYGQLYYNSIVDLYAEWGVDFIKVDDMSRPYAAEEINMLRKAIDQCGRPIVLSLSPGKTAYDKIDDLHQKTNMWRMMDDLWDNWPSIKNVFTEADYWSKHHQPGCYADCDMLPIGQIGMTVYDEGYCKADSGRKSGLTEDELRTMMTLWGICHSPLFIGGDLTMMDQQTLRLLTNEDYLNMHAYGVEARQISNEEGRIQWTSIDPETGDRYLALFYTDPKTSTCILASVTDNTGDSNVYESSNFMIDFTSLGFEKGQKVKVYDVWDNGKLLGTFSGTELTQTVKRHGVKLLRLKPERSGKNSLRLQSSAIGNGNFLITATINGHVDEHSYVKFLMDGKFVGSVKVEPITKKAVYHLYKPTKGKHTFQAFYSGTATTPSCRQIKR